MIETTEDITLPAREALSEMDGPGRILALELARLLVQLARANRHPEAPLDAYQEDEAALQLLGRMRRSLERISAGDAVSGDDPWETLASTLDASGGTVDLGPVAMSGFHDEAARAFTLSPWFVSRPVISADEH